MRPAVILISVVVLLLDYAALDDITTGRDRSLFLEYTFLAVSAVWIVAATRLLRQRRSDVRE